MKDKNAYVQVVHGFLQYIFVFVFFFLIFNSNFNKLLSVSFVRCLIPTFFCFCFCLDENFFPKHNFYFLINLGDSIFF